MTSPDTNAHRDRSRLALLTATLATTLGALSLASGCRSGTDPNIQGPAFPAQMAQTSTLDIQVVRDETTIRLTNTTARQFGKSRLWLNRWFSRDIEKLDVGQTLTLDLGDFEDQYGERFRSGGFFATREPTPLSQAQLETADSLIGLVVVTRGEE